MRKNFTLSAAQHVKLLDAMQPVRAMWVGGPPRSVQQNANDAWVALGHEMGFDGMTVRGVPGGSEYEFSAEEAPITRPAQKSPADLEYESWVAGAVPPISRGWPADHDADPVPLTKLPPAIVVHPQLGELFDRLSMHTYAMGYALACTTADRSKPAELDVAGQPKPPLTVLEHAAVVTLNTIKAWRDSEGNEPFPDDARQGMELVLMLAVARRKGVR